MRSARRIIVILTAIIMNMTTRVWASEEISKASMADSTDVYRQAFFAAAATMLVMGILWLIIFRPKFKSSSEEF